MVPVCDLLGLPLARHSALFLSITHLPCSRVERLTDILTCDDEQQSQGGAQDSRRGRASGLRQTPGPHPRGTAQLPAREARGQCPLGDLQFFSQTWHFHMPSV